MCLILRDLLVFAAEFSASSTVVWLDCSRGFLNFG